MWPEVFIYMQQEVFPSWLDEQKSRAMHLSITTLANQFKFKLVYWASRAEVIFSLGQIILEILYNSLGYN